jgi:hypothetical protein
LIRSIDVTSHALGPSVLHKETADSTHACVGVSLELRLDILASIWYYKYMNAEPGFFNRIRQMPKSLIAAGVAVCALTGYAADPQIRDRVNAVIMACDAPSPEAIQAVTQMFDSPRPDLPRGSTRAQRAAFGAQERQELGIAFPEYDEKEIIARSQNDPFEHYFNVTKNILDQLNIPLRIGPPKDMNGDHAEIPTQAELETAKAKFQVLALARIFAYTPMSLTKSLGIKEVALTAHGKDYDGLTLIDQGVLIVDVANVGEEEWDVATHELYHLVDAAECGPHHMDNDPAYTAWNRHSKYAGNKWPLPPNLLQGQPPSFEAIEKQDYQLSDKQYAAAKVGDPAAYCQARKAEDTLLAGIEMQSDYSHRDVAEDKAELGKNIFEPISYFEMLDSRAPARRGKFLVLLARMYEHNPNVVRDYSLEATRPLTPTYACG